MQTIVWFRRGDRKKWSRFCNIDLDTLEHRIDECGMWRKGRLDVKFILNSKTSTKLST